MIVQIENVPLPEWLMDLAFCEVNKAYIESDEINNWALEHLLPIVKGATGIQNLDISANHVHIGDAGLTPHDHLPHAFTSVLYLCDAEGELVIHIQNDDCEIKPKEGLLVFFPADLVHHVKPSPHEEMRLSFVSNYEYLEPAV